MKKKKRPKLNLSAENHSLLSRRVNELVRRATPAERHVRALLDELGEDYQFQRGFFTEHRFFIVDFYFRKPRKLCLELDGPSHKRQVAYDKARDTFLTKARRVRVIRITNTKALGLDKEQLLALIG